MQYPKNIFSIVFLLLEIGVCTWRRQPPSFSRTLLSSSGLHYRLASKRSRSILNSSISELLNFSTPQLLVVQTFIQDRAKECRNSIDTSIDTMSIGFNINRVQLLCVVLCSITQFLTLTIIKFFIFNKETNS